MCDFIKFCPSRRQAIAGAVAAVAFAGSARGGTSGEDVDNPLLPLAADPGKPWTGLPPTPDLPTPDTSATVPVNGTEIFYASFGTGPSVVLLHGGMGNSNYWGHQIRHLAGRFRVIAMDTRGHGRSPLLSNTFGYALFAQDVVALLDRLGIAKASIVGWSDGAITGFELAMRDPRRVSRLFAFGGNVWRNAIRHGGGRGGTFRAYAKRCKVEYASLSPEPDKWPDLMTGLRAMWHGQAEYSPLQLARIVAPTVIADGAYDEIIKPGHAIQIAQLIHGARALILPKTSHFAMLQDPAGFNAALDRFLSTPV